jgi:uncharacterized protein YukE
MGGTDATAPQSFDSEYHPGLCAPGEVRTAFAEQESIDSMHAMLAWAKPKIVTRVADAWQEIHDRLVGGTGTVQGDFDKAVEHILQHWEGDAADAFAKKAKKISKQIADCASYASYTSTAMHNAGRKLAEIKPKVDEIEPPSKASSVLNAVGDGFTRNDQRWHSAIHDNQGAQTALNKYDDDLSAGKEEQLKAAALMEDLALTYTSQTKAMGSWRRSKPGVDEEDPDYPGAPGGIAPVPLPVVPDFSSPPPAAGGGIGRPLAAGVGRASPASTPAPPPEGAPAAKTTIDAASTKHPTNTGHAETVTTAPRTGNPTTGPVTTPPGGPGRVGRTSGNRGTPRTGPGDAAEEHPTAGRRGGMHGGSGAGGGKNAGGATTRSSLARRKGGRLDEPSQPKGSAARPVGQGLHSSRGGSQAGERGRKATRLGPPVSSKTKGKEKKNEEQRPDYLVEDEETWMPRRRDVAPPTVD